MNYQLIGPVLGFLRLVFAALLLCSLGLWIELLWFSATHSSDSFWRFSQERIMFALAGTLFACALCGLYRSRTQPSAPDHRSGALIYTIAVLVGAISGLGLWEFLRMLFTHSEAAELLRAWQHHSLFY